MSSKAESELVARELRHDVRNQLFALRTTLALLEQTIEEPERLRRNLHACAAVLEKLTSEIQEYFALETGEPPSGRVQLRDLIGDAVQTFGAPAASLGIELHYTPTEMYARVRPLLFTMAFKHMMRALIRLASGHIEVEIRTISDHVGVALRYSPRSEIAAESRREADEDLAAARQSLALFGGRLSEEPGVMTAMLPDGQSHPES